MALIQPPLCFFIYIFFILQNRKALSHIGRWCQEVCTREKEGLDCMRVQLERTRETERYK